MSNVIKTKKCQPATRAGLDLIQTAPIPKMKLSKIKSSKPKITKMNTVLK